MALAGRASPGRASPGRRVRTAMAAALPPLVVLLVVLGAWWAASELLLTPQRRFLLPPPAAVWRVGFADRANLTVLLAALGLSARVALVGLAAATVLGIAFAVLLHQARWLERSLYPYAVVLQTVPVLALVPLFGFWFGFGLFSRELVCVLVAVFPIIANTLFGLRSAGRSLHDLLRLHRAGRLATLVKLELPAALPAIFTGLRISAGLSVIGAIVGDFFFKQGRPGIGILIDVYRQQLHSEQLFAAVLLSCALGVLVFWTFGLLSRWVVGVWRDTGIPDA